MTNSDNMQLNKLNYDREREIVEFSLRRKLDDSAIIINGEVPVMIIDQGNLRQFAKAAVRQALLDAAEALAEHEPDAGENALPEEGTRPEDLNAANDD